MNQGILRFHFQIVTTFPATESTRAIAPRPARLCSRKRRPKVFLDLSRWPCRLIHHQLEGSVAAQGFGVRAGFVRFIHDALTLDAIDSRQLRMQFHCQAVAALLFLVPVYQCP